MAVRSFPPFRKSGERMGHPQPHQYPSRNQVNAPCLSDGQNCGGVAGSAAESMPSHIPLFTVKLPWASSFTVQMVS
jgi:hypothetical protein